MNRALDFEMLAFPPTDASILSFCSPILELVLTFDHDFHDIFMHMGFYPLFTLSRHVHYLHRTLLYM